VRIRKLVFKRETRKPTPSEHRLIVRLIKSGRSYGGIARVLGCSRGSLRDYCVENGLGAGRPLKFGGD